MTPDITEGHAASGARQSDTLAHSRPAQASPVSAGSAMPLIELPDVQLFQTRPWEDGVGSEYYGALHVAAAYCGIPLPKFGFAGVWQHGAVPPWQQVQPEMCIYDAPRSRPVLVARQDEVQYLKSAGYKRAKAIGLPIVYTEPQQPRRVPGSLLVMPMHAIPNDTNAADSDRYIEDINQYRHHFSHVMACISGRCIDSGLWKHLFDRANVPVVRGSSVDDATSLTRMRRLLETVEYVTTNAFGSHVVYALYFGAKVSIWGWAEPLTREYLLRDALWARFPEAADRFVSEQTAVAREAVIGKFRVPPHLGVTDTALGARLVGAENRLSSRELASALGWTTIGRTTTAIRCVVRSLMPPRLQNLLRGQRT